MPPYKSWTAILSGLFRRFFDRLFQLGLVDEAKKEARLGPEQRGRLKPNPSTRVVQVLGFSQSQPRNVLPDSTSLALVSSSYFLFFFFYQSASHLTC